MSSDSSYHLTIVKSNAFDPAILDKEFLIFRLLKEVEEAKHFFGDDGKFTGNGGTWRTIEEDMRAFSAAHPEVLFLIEEKTPDYDHEARYYFSAGRSKTVEPVKTWPVVTSDMLS